MIPYGRQDISEQDVGAVADTLRSDWLTQGPAVPRFEEALAGRCRAKHAVAVNSATSALHIACLALLPSDRRGLVWTSPITFVASANSARYCGADIDFVDIEPETRNISVAALAAKLEQARRAGRLPDILIPVHFAGHPCDMKAIRALSDEYGFKVVVDASHAVGGAYDGAPVGNGRYADATVFSFHPVKIMTTAEGGAVLCDDEALARRLGRLRSHGITREAGEMAGESHGPWYYEQVELGFNYRMTDLQAALGSSQIERLDAFVARRRQVVETYRNQLADLPLALPVERPWARSSWHLYAVAVADPAWRRPLFELLRQRGLGVQVHYIPVHTQPDYRPLGFGPGMFPVAEDYYSRAISLPLFSAMTDGQVDEVIETVRRSVREIAGR